MESCSEVIFHHLDLPVKSVRLLAKATSACNDGIVSADVYTCMNVYSIGGWLIKKTKKKGTIDVVLSIWGCVILLTLISYLIPSNGMRTPQGSSIYRKAPTRIQHAEKRLRKR